MANIKKLATESQSLSKISFSTKWDGQRYRGITDSSSGSFETYSIHKNNNNGPLFVPSQLKSSPQPISTQSKSCSVLQFSINTQYPKSKAPAIDNNVLPTLQPLNIMVTSMDIEDEHDAEMKLNMIEPISLAHNVSSNKYCNELNSYLVDECIDQVLNSLNNILRHYSDDIDYTMDDQQKRIDGLVFISNHCVYFIIYVWQCDNNGTRIEFRRTSGDSLASAKFWSQLKGLYKKQTQKYPIMDVQSSDEDEITDFIELDLDLTSIDGGDQYLSDNDQHLSTTDLDELTQCLQDNDLFVVDELNYLHESMVENKSICNDILSHQPFMKQLVNDSMLNSDICVIRNTLLILNELAALPDHKMCIMDDLQLFNNINLLLNHQRQLVRKYTIRLLSHLSNTNDWKIDDVSKTEMIKNVQKYESEFANHLTVEIKKINEKLMMK